MSDVQIIDRPEQAHELARVLAQVWGGADPIPADVVTAIIHAGGYASLATRIVNGQKQIVGGSLGIIGNNDQKLHSHVTGVIDLATNSGVGRALKQHQWLWAKENKLSAISWTFDPLVRRNAHFNLVTLGATVMSYKRNYYGELNDLINSGDQTDRLVVERQVEGLIVAPTSTACIATDGDLIIETPKDIVMLRTSDREKTHQLRLAQRTSFEAAFAGSYFVRGFTSDGSFVMTSQAK